MLRAVLFFLSCASYAGQPVFLFTPISPTSFYLYPENVQDVKFRITNLSSAAHTVQLLPLPVGVTQLLTGENSCQTTQVLAAGEHCTLRLHVTAGELPRGGLSFRPKLCQLSPNGTPSPYFCYQAASADTINVQVSPFVGTKISASVSFLALSVNNQSLNSALSGNPRTITITNSNSGITAQAVTATIYSRFPDQTSISGCSGVDLAPGQSCTITVTPGSVSSSAAGENPEVSIILVHGANTSVLLPEVLVLSYGSVYESAILFNMNDSYSSYPISGSIGGTGIARAAQEPTIAWSTTEDNIPGILETSTTPCVGNSDGVCNTNQIVQYYASLPNTFYAAQLCTRSIDGYSDWYLPAICQLGVGTEFGTGCGTQSAPTIQNVLSSLVYSQIYPQVLLYNSLWSSTEWSVQPAGAAFYQDRNLSQYPRGKTDSQVIAVRCTRNYTQPA